MYLYKNKNLTIYYKMKFETIILNYKFKYFNHVMFKNRHLFYNQNYIIDVDKLITHFNYANLINRLTKREYQLYRSKRCQIIRKFNKDMIKIKYNEIESILRLYFCTDIKNLILEFMMSYKPKNIIYSKYIK